MEKNWIHIILLLFASSIVLVNIAQCQKNDGPIGAHRVYRKTSFSCHGRTNGYYADVETGCQVYHMCDGLGRQFSYSCPNTTLFQQRMLICDHWYMVNCSRAESDYDANLLIGQRDKPFVPDDEHHLRTPRPDLLDRPYAPDYSGESFRNQFEVPQVLNQIDETSQDEEIAAKQQFQLNPPPSSTRWRITVPSREILPPAPSPLTVSIRRMDEIDDENPDLGTSFSSNYNTSADVSSEEEKSVPVIQTTSTTSSTPSSKNIFTTRKQSYKPTFSSISYKAPTIFTTTTPKLSPKQPNSNVISETEIIKVPSKLYEPPYLYPIWNENYTTSDEYNFNQTEKLTTNTATTRSPFRIISSSAPFSPTSTTATTSHPISQPLTRPTTSSGKPFTRVFSSSTTPTYDAVTDKYSNAFETLQQSESSNRAPTSFNNYDFSRFIVKSSPDIYNSKTTQQLNERKNSNSELLKKKPIVVASQPGDDSLSSNENEGFHQGSILDYNIPTDGEKFNSSSSFSKPIRNSSESDNDGQFETRKSNGVPIPALELVPPFPDYIQHDVATTQGPPIYFEWKIPSNALEPPKLDPPIGVDGRLPDYEIEYQKTQKKYSNDQSQFQEQEYPSEQQQLPLKEPSPTFLPDDSHLLQASQLEKGSFGKKIQSSVFSSEIPSTELQPPYTEHQNFSTNTNNSTNNINKNFQFSHNPFLSTLATKSQRSVNTSTKIPSSSPRPFSTSNKRELVSGSQNKKAQPSEIQIQQLKRQLSIPDFLFPLESGRTGYDFNESKNSFQLKIPKRRSDDKSKWYGENPNCPECHPSFAKPGSCEPCIKRR